MKFQEVKESQELAVPEDNEFTKAEKMDTRRPRLTLEHLARYRDRR